MLDQKLYKEVGEYIDKYFIDKPDDIKMDVYRASGAGGQHGPPQRLRRAAPEGQLDRRRPPWHHLRP